jgi:hypothetical protein
VYCFFGVDVDVATALGGAINFCNYFLRLNSLDLFMFSWLSAHAIIYENENDNKLFLSSLQLLL